MPVARVAILSAVVSLSSIASADDVMPPGPEQPVPPAKAVPALRMSVEIDPADYTLYDGWGVFVGIRPEATGRWRFRLGGGAATLPKAATETNDNNKGWRQRLEPVVTLAAHRYFGRGRGGFFVGPVVGVSSLTFTAPSGGEVDVRNVFAGIDFGYRWFPFDRFGLVITPHLGAIVPIYKSNEPTVEMETYDLLPVIPLPQLLVGYECDVLGG
ncbi:MAG TPA: hypothetical protein VIU61_12375 [Kofleriaceae bacterium]